MACILTAHAPIIDIRSFPHFLDESGKWHDDNAKDNRGILSNLWYRGVNGDHAQVPRVYRKPFTDGANRQKVKGGLEEKRLYLEREMLSQFRNYGAPWWSGATTTEIYFDAQHYGMPTRLLDWSTNPLASLFFACEKEPGDGFVYAMDAGYVIPPNATTLQGERLYHSVMSMRNSYVSYAVGISFWEKEQPTANAYILPVRPDRVPGRISQQSSCFTLHMHGASNVTNNTLKIFKVLNTAKAPIMRELQRVNINQFTAYHDLDHLSMEIRRTWAVCD